METLKKGQKVRVIADRVIRMFVGKRGTVMEVLPDGSAYVRFYGETEGRWRYWPEDLEELKR